MSTKRNKKRYQRHEKDRPLLTCTGTCYLRYRDDEEIACAAKGDFMLQASVEALHTIRQGDYESTGHAGYFRVDIHDGRDWQPVLLAELFPEGQHHFRKSECPIDTYAVCEEHLQTLAGRRFRRTYREHYELVEEEAGNEE